MGFQKLSQHQPGKSRLLFHKTGIIQPNVRGSIYDQLLSWPVSSIKINGTLNLARAFEKLETSGTL